MKFFALALIAIVAATAEEDALATATEELATATADLAAKQDALSEATEAKAAILADDDQADTADADTAIETATADVATAQTATDTAQTAFDTATAAVTPAVDPPADDVAMCTSGDDCGADEQCPTVAWVIDDEASGYVAADVDTLKKDAESACVATDVCVATETKWNEDHPADEWDVAGVTSATFSCSAKTEEEASSPVLPIVLVLLGLVAVGGGAYWYKNKKDASEGGFKASLI